MAICNELAEHFRADHQTVLCTPVIMLEKGIRRITAFFFPGHFQIPVNKKIKHVMDSLGFFVHTDHGAFHAHEIMQLFKKTVDGERRHEFVIPVDFIQLLADSIPFLLRVFRRIRVFRFKNLTPGGNVLYQPVRIIQKRKRTGLTFRPVDRDAPVIGECGSGSAETSAVRMNGIQDQLQIFVLIDETVGFSQTDRFKNILFFCQQNGYTSSIKEK